ncbi:MAG: 3-oxoacid CoA-transferase subunit B [Bacilli bacterium]|nr:3-oxoacid CoA-transferase subunit B [Bacilli bacterium]
MDSKILIAKRVAKELRDGDIVNLGIGLPTMVAEYVPKDIEVFFQSENGLINLGPRPEEDLIDLDVVNAGGSPVSILKGGAYFDSATSFMIIRGGHVDVTVLGSLQVDEEGSIANWIIPGKLVPGMGGAMDLLCGSKKVIVAMMHTNKGMLKILKKCSLPLTAVKEVNWIFTELGVMEITKEGIVLREYNPNYSIDYIQEMTEAKLIIPSDIKVMEIE